MITYRPAANRADRTASQILNAVDDLGKNVAGIRAIYECLCEFAHPNVGTLLALTKSAVPLEEPRGVHWVSKELTLGLPEGVITQMKPILVATLTRTGIAVESFRALLDESEQHDKNILAMVQVMVKHSVLKNPGVLDPYVLCPCASGAKLKFCCARR